MLTLIFSTTISIGISAVFYLLTTNVPFHTSFTFAIFLILLLGINFLWGRVFFRKTKDMMNNVEKDIKNNKIPNAISKLKEGYKYKNWQLMLGRQLDSQIGSLYYANKQFKEAEPYLKKSYTAQWMAGCMYGALIYKTKKYDRMEEVMDKVIKKAGKNSFPYAFYAYLLHSIKKTDKAVTILTKGTNKVKGDKALTNSLANLKNGKAIKMQGYGAMWMQMHLTKTPDGAKQYQQHIFGGYARRR